MTKKRWSSLSQVKSWLISNRPKEKIIYFDGIYLKTSEAVYGLGAEQLYVYDKDSELYATVDILPEKSKETSENVLTASNNDSSIEKVASKKKAPRKKTKRKKVSKKT